MRALKLLAHRRRYPRRYQHLQQLLANQRLSRRALQDKCEQDLHALLQFARTHCAWYRQRYADLPPTAPLQALPPLTKDDVRAHLHELLADDHDPHTTPLGHTGGSTGAPLAFWYNEEKHELMRAGMMRSYMLSGWRPGQRILNFWGARQDVVPGGVFGGAALADFIAAERTLAAADFDDSQLAAWAKLVRRWRPTLLQGYTSILAALGRHVLAHGPAMPDSLGGVYVTAEMLAAHQREDIEAAFGCKVFNQYGCREVPNIACQCRHGGMHLFSDLVRLESDDGRLLLTSLSNRLMPMIRYQVGDAGRLVDGECECGSPFPLMSMDMCRQNDFLIGVSGRRLHPALFNRMLYGMTHIEQYRFEQTRPGHVTLHLQCPQPPDADWSAALAARLLTEADGLQLHIACSDKLARNNAGKHRFVIRHGAVTEDRAAAGE